MRSLDPGECERCGGQSKSLRRRSYAGRRYRRLECVKCGERWTTWEIRLTVELIDFMARHGFNMDGVTSNR